MIAPLEADAVSGAMHKIFPVTGLRDGLTGGVVHLPAGNFLSRGKDVTLPENTPLEIGFAPARQDGKKSAPAKP